MSNWKRREGKLQQRQMDKQFSKPFRKKLDKDRKIKESQKIREAQRAKSVAMDDDEETIYGQGYDR